MCKHFMIVGADFKNKGGQSMMFNMVDFLRKNFPECKIVVPMTNTEERDLYNFNIIYYDYDTQKVALADILPMGIIIRLLLKKILKSREVDIFALKNNIKKTDCMIDISGFNLSSEWNISTNEKYLRYIELAKKYDVPVILMPQSFGPFDYSQDVRGNLYSRIKNCLNYCALVIAREKKGYVLLKDMGIRNLRLTPDLVLQRDEIDVKNIYVNNPELKDVAVKENSIAIIPNMKSFEHGNKDEIISLYADIIRLMKTLNKNVYLMRHAKEDLKACEWIYEGIENKDDIVFIRDEFNCIEYERIVKKFDYIIASRYHSIVHAYKGGIPAIVLGWSEKYNELVKHFDQCDYQFSITGKICTAKILTAIEMMNQSYFFESDVICRCLNQLHEKDNCFHMVLDVVRKGIRDD